MKLTTLLLIISFLEVSASSFGQRFTYKANNLSITKVFYEIRKQTGYDVLVETDQFKTSKSIDVNFNNTKLEDVLAKLTEGTDLTFTIEDKTIVIKPKDVSFLQKLKDKVNSIIQLNKDIRGRVSDTSGTLLTGASVTLKNENFARTVLSDNNGIFEIPAVPDGDYTLTVTYVGYEKYEIKIASSSVAATLSVVLSKASSALDQVQVIAYGRNTKRFSVGAVATITSEIIEKQPVTNPLLTLQGQVPGLIVTPTGGAPGSAVKLQIRGQNSLRPTSSVYAPQPYDQPLYIVDGVPFAPQSKTLGNLLTYSISANSQSVLPDNGISPFELINPQDIESISVLKDADATSIYGSQGVNGVIIITTKKGAAGKALLNVNVNSGFSAPTRQLQMMNTQQYLAMRREALAIDKVTLTSANANTYPDLQIFDQTRSVDWYKQFFDRTPFNTNIHASFSGGQNNSTYIFSGGYNKTTYNFPGDYADNRITFHGNYTYRSIDNRFTVQFGTDYAYDKNFASSAPSVAAAMSLAPNFPEMIDAQGNLIWSYKTYKLGSLNQYSKLLQPANIQSYDLNNTVRLSYEVIPNLLVSANMGYSRVDSKNYTATPKSVLDPFNTNLQSSATFINNVYQTLNIEPQLNYQHQLGQGVLSVLLGGTYKKQFSDYNYLRGANYPNDDLLGSVNGATTITGQNSNTIYKYAAAYARINYIYDQKYILNLTGRRDGSSNFGPDRQFGNFGSVGLGWIFSEESGFKNALPFVSFGKLSSNYGTNGTDGVAPYSYQAFYTVAYTTQYGPYQGARAFMPANLYNPNYSWSTKKSLNATLDLGFFKDKLLLNVTAYQSRTSNELINYALPSQTGFSAVLDNFPATLQNRGLEFTVTSNNIKDEDFKWTTTFNIAFNKNKLVSFPGLATSSYADVYVIGKSPNTVFAFNYKGVNPTTGLFEFYKTDGSITTNPTQTNATAGGDLKPLFDRDPKFSGGFGNTFTYKNFSLLLFFQFAKQTAYNYLAGIYSYGMPGRFNNLPTAVIGNYWQKAGDQRPMERLSGAYGDGASTIAANAFMQSSGAYSDDTYLRLKTVSLSYSLPKQWVRHIGAKNVNVYANAQNLLTFTNYKIGDPEQPGVLYTIPLQRNIVAGLSLTF
ncbi:SusC/RagA family TonB-linked outer membrane protein [Mucilaginibacter ximonensis]|uniref:SusC/RagA family TonB-linked outer membrane protein n=1 Tax=Mucilaginibacter ximonensis TaxID=538021 RepID=A0ABW5YG54_9SPHI